MNSGRCRGLTSVPFGNFVQGTFEENFVIGALGRFWCQNLEFGVRSFMFQVRRRHELLVFSDLVSHWVRVSLRHLQIFKSAAELPRTMKRDSGWL